MSTGVHQNEVAPAVPFVPTTGVVQAANKPSQGEASESRNAPSAKSSILDSSFPVLLPYDDPLFMQQGEFDALVKELVGGRQVSPLNRPAETETGDEPVHKAPFIQGLEKHASHTRTAEKLAKENKTLTENSDVTYVSSKDPLVDLLYDLEQNTPSNRLKSLLEAAWAKEPLTTLRIIFNARSMHLGKSNKIAAYKALGWLAESHPRTLLATLVWLTRPVIEKKVPGAKNEKSTDAEEAASTNDPIINEKGAHIVTNESEVESRLKAHDVRFGVSHGYYKDLLNILVFTANDQLRLDGDPASLLTQKQDRTKV
jgi:hypothetical protein